MFFLKGMAAKLKKRAMAEYSADVVEVKEEPLEMEEDDDEVKGGKRLKLALAAMRGPRGQPGLRRGPPGAAPGTPCWGWRGPRTRQRPPPL